MSFPAEMWRPAFQACSVYSAVWKCVGGRVLVNISHNRVVLQFVTEVHNAAGGDALCVSSNTPGPSSGGGGGGEGGWLDTHQLVFRGTSQREKCLYSKLTLALEDFPFFTLEYTRKFRGNPPKPKLAFRVWVYYSNLECFRGKKPRPSQIPPLASRMISAENWTWMLFSAGC